MLTWLSILLAACLPLFPLATFAANDESQTSNHQAPPVAQTLVREGDFAVRLAADLKLGKPADEAEAEHMLSTAGVAPMNGWISDYPVTPQIIGQVDNSIATAAASGKLKMSVQEASMGLHQLVAQLNLPAPAGNETAPAAEVGSSVVNNYYYNQGPPVVTYYPPPEDYAYLYDWVPFPVVWFGFGFPGFFICHNFTTFVFVSHGTFVRGTAIVSNRIFNPAIGRFVVIDPVVRTSTGAVRPMTAFRGTGGRSFMTLADMGRGTALSGVSPVRTAAAFRNTGRSGSFGSLEARRSAQSIFSRSMMAMNARPGSRVGPSVRGPMSGPVMRGGGAGGHGPISGAPPRGGGGMGGHSSLGGMRR